MKRISKLAIMVFALVATPAVAQIENYDESEIPLGLQEQVEADDAWDKYLTSDEEANMADKDPYTSDEVFEQRIMCIPGSDIMGFTYNDIVKGYIERYTKKMRGSVAKMLGKYNLYGSIFDDILMREDIPDLLRYLPMIESGLNARAKSPAGAGGLWQFMPSVAKSYDLQVNSWVDERADPYKGTVAAAKLLRTLYNKYQDWNLVLAAYNCGAGNVNKAISRSGGKRDYWEIYPFLPRETRGYVPAFIAAVYVMQYYSQHNIKAARIENPTKYDSIVVHYDIKMESIARELGIELSEIRSLNTQYNSTFIPGARRKCTIILPEHLVEEFAGKEYGMMMGHQQTVTDSDPDVIPAPEMPEGSEADATQVASTQQTLVVPQRNTSGNVTEVGDDDDDELSNPVSIPTRGYNAKPATNPTRNVAQPQKRAEQPAPAQPTNGATSRYSRPANTTPTPAPSPAAKSNTTASRSQATTSTKTQPATSTKTQSAAEKTQSAAEKTQSSAKTQSASSAKSKAQEPATTSSKNTASRKTSDTQKNSTKTVAKTTAKAPAKTQPKAPAAKEVTVKSGDNLSKIAAAHGTTVSELRKQNPNLKGDKLMPGETLKVKPAPKTPAKSTPAKKK